ncbi:hypothetical protein JXA70_03560 [candidate division KSB1 bacterium]|nr:hypothetical protein [candidate division KSB1 bacterium]
MANNDLQERVQAIKEISSFYRLERIIYICVIVFCFIVFAASVLLSLFRGELGSVEISSMFSSGGVITVMTGRLMHMWNRSMQMLDGASGGGE